MNLPPHWDEMANAEHAAGFEAELRRECVPGHALYGIAASAVATANGSDDALFHLADGRWALVHLTWQAETSPKWPMASVYADKDTALGVLWEAYADLVDDESE